MVTSVFGIIKYTSDQNTLWYWCKNTLNPILQKIVLPTDLKYYKESSTMLLL